ncbi:MAG: hypothetical protein IJ620_04945 [Bacteroidales bacterium]|nr:hypothetical protein [Bacteroidales bacterium]
MKRHILILLTLLCTLLAPSKAQNTLPLTDGAMGDMTATHDMPTWEEMGMHDLLAYAAETLVVSTTAARLQPSQHGGMLATGHSTLTQTRLASHKATCPPHTADYTLCHNCQLRL